MRRLSGLALCIAMVLAGGCGFHLRGAVVLPEAMARTQLRGVDPRAELAEEIRNVLQDAGAQVVDAGEPAGAMLEITANRFERRVASVDGSGKATQYELRYVIEGLLREPGAGAMVPGQRATVVRLLNFESNALGAATEEEMLRREMQRDGVRQLIRQLRVALANRAAASGAPGSPADAARETAPQAPAAP